MASVEACFSSLGLAEGILHTGKTELGPRRFGSRSRLARITIAQDGANVADLDAARVALLRKRWWDSDLYVQNFEMF